MVSAFILDQKASVFYNKQIPQSEFATSDKKVTFENPEDLTKHPLIVFAGIGNELDEMQLAGKVNAVEYVELQLIKNDSEVICRLENYYSEKISGATNLQKVLSTHDSTYYKKSIQNLETALAIGKNTRG